MRKSALLLVSVCAFAAAAPAQARDGAWYVGGDFGAVIVEDTNFDFQAASPPNTFGELSLNHDYGYDAALFVGYDLGTFRLEAESSYKRASLDEFTVAGAPLVSTGTPHPVGVHDAGGGSTSALSFMVNGFLDFGEDDGVSGFVGAGAGIARVDFNNLRAFSNTGAFLDEADSGFAWQVLAGIRKPISSKVDLSLKYRFFNVPGLDVAGVTDLPIDSGKFQSHSLLAGITFNFGGTPSK